MDNGISKLKQKSSRHAAFIAALLTLAIFVFNGAAQAQTDLPPPGGGWSSGNNNSGNLGEDAAQTNPTSRQIYDASGQTTLVREQAEQNVSTVAQSVEAKLWPSFGSYNDVYQGLSAFWGDDIISNFFANIGQLIGKWLSEFINGWIADAVQFLTGFLRIFVLNPNIATNGLSPTGGPADDISPYIRQGADIMYGIAVDLLLLLFILCIWKYWAEAAWRGGGNLMGAVGRLIFTAGLMLAWPTIYAFEIQITNEMIRAIYFNSADQVAMLDAAMAAAVKAGLVAGAGLLANATAPIAGQVFGGLLAGGAGGIVLGTVGGFVAFVGLILYLVIGGILVAELIYILVLKAIQTALLCAQYMFAPIFLVFFALPDTENVTSGFVRSFVEVSLWTFVWVGMLKIMVVVILSDFNPWGKIIMAVGVLQLMIQVPTFLARAQISPMSDFISAGLITGGILGAGKALSNVFSNRGMHLANAIGNFGYAGAKGAPKSQNVDLKSPDDVTNPALLKNQRDASAFGTVNGQGQKLNAADEEKKKKADALNGANGPNGKKNEQNPLGTPPPQGQQLTDPAAKGPQTEAEKAAARQKQADMAAMLSSGLAARGAGLNADGTPKAGQPSVPNSNVPGPGVPPALNPDGTPKVGQTGVPKPGDAAGAVKPGEKALTTPTGVPVGPGNAGLEGKTDANLKNKPDAAAAGNAANPTGKALTPEDAAKLAANAGANAGLPGAKPKDNQVDVEQGANAAGALPGQGGKLNQVAGDPAGKGMPGLPGGERSTIKSPGLNAMGQTADTNLIPKPGVTPANAMPAPGSSAQLADATRGINRGVADPTTKAVNTDVSVDGDPGAPLSQVNTSATGKILGAAAPLAAGAALGATAAALGANAAGRTNAQGQRVEVQGQQTGVAPQAPPTQFTQVQSGGRGNVPPVPPGAAIVDGNGPNDDGTGGGNFSGGVLPPLGSAPQRNTPNPNDPRPDMFNNHHQAGYNKVPFRVAAANARLAQGATIGTSATGSDYVVYDNQGHAMHYRFAEGASQERKAMGMIAGSLGELMGSDAEAYDAARQSSIDAGEHKPQGAMERMAAGILAYNGSSWTQTAAAKQRFARSMAKHANIGAQAYVNGGQGNAYTQFLENRYGLMDDEKQAEAVHIMTTDDTPESGWSWRLQPATDALIQNGIGISPINRACASNMAVLKSQPWLRGAAIRGSAAYMESKANAAIPEDTHPMVRNSWYAHHAQAMTPETVNCVGALTLASGNADICRDSAMVDQVVSMVPTGGRPEDYVGAYNALQTGTRVVKSMSAPRGGATVVSGGGFSGGGGGSVGTNNAEMEVLFDQGGGGGGSFDPNSVNVGNVAGGSAMDTRVDVRSGAAPGASGANLGRQTVRTTGNANVNSRVQMGSVTQSGGGGNRVEDNVQVDVEIGDRGAPGGSMADIQKAALDSALQYHNGSSTELVKSVTARLVASGMSYNDINSPQLMETAIQSYASNPHSLPQVAIASNAVGSANVTPQDVEIVQNMQDSDPRWDSRSINYGAMYTARCIMQAHQSNPQAYGPAYLTQEYVQKVASHPSFKPREVPMRGANGQVAYQENTPVPHEVILSHLADQMRRFGNVQ